MIRALIAVTLALAPPAAAQNTRSLDGRVSPSASIDQLSWLVGSWAGTGMGAEVAETYSAAFGGRITGHFTMADGKGGIRFTEIVDYVPVGQSLAFRVRHFNPDMSGWEDQTGKPVVFPLVAIEKDRWFFDGMTIERTGPDTLTTWVRISQKGVEKEVPFQLVRRR